MKYDPKNASQSSSWGENQKFFEDWIEKDPKTQDNKVYTFIRIGKHIIHIGQKRKAINSNFWLETFEGEENGKLIRVPTYINKKEPMMHFSYTLKGDIIEKAFESKKESEGRPPGGTYKVMATYIRKEQPFYTDQDYDSECEISEEEEVVEEGSKTDRRSKAQIKIDNQRIAEKKAAKEAKRLQKAVDKMIDALWDKYDVNGSGVLEKSECRKFIEETLGKIGGDAFDDEQFDDIYGIIDEDGNGTIDRTEMNVFIK